MNPAAQRLLANLQQVAGLRARLRADPPAADAHHRLKRWQVERLKRTYADLEASPRYAAATEFFAEEVYGAEDVSWRDAQFTRMVPTMLKLLPERVIETVALAIELDALTVSLDHDMLDDLPRDDAGRPRIDEATYAHAYRKTGRRSDREHQVELIIEVGEDLDWIVKKPLVSTALKLCRAPAKAAGLGDLQGFLERGFSAFGKMKGAETFLGTIAGRERNILDKLFANARDPFDWRA